ncbi:MAG: 50S ribosome-binding GTPase [Candidatus Micrarchaeota archaeon]|nr:50S ribosome-binding GTPase [Candidatus Micrarchaeota archaeon]
MQNSKPNVIKVVLLGLPNVGKTTLFNKISNSFQKTGNYFGKTYENISTIIKHKNFTIELVDTPGIDSFSDSDIREFIDSILKDYGQSNKVVFVQVIDSTKLKRSLYFTNKLLGYVPHNSLVLAFSFTDHISNQQVIQEIKKRLEEAHQIKSLAVNYKDKEFVHTFLDDVIKACSENQQTLFQISQNLDLLNDKLLVELIETTKKQTNKTDYDYFLLHPVYGFIIFFAVMYSIFFLSNTIADFLNTILIDKLIDLFKQTIVIFSFNIIIHSFLYTVIIIGVGSLLYLFPSMIIIITLITILEHSGYVVRPVLLFHKLLKPLALDDKSIVPLILGFSCNVPGILATNMIKDEISKFLTVFCVPSIICSGRYIVLLFFAKLLFPQSVTTVMFIMYLLSIVSMVIASVFARAIFYKKVLTHSSWILVELPQIRVPNLSLVVNDVRPTLSHFGTKLFTILFFGAIVIYLLSKFPSGTLDNSFAALIGNVVIAPLKLLGINSWQLGLAIVNGIVGKELIIASLAMTYLQPNQLFYEDFDSNSEVLIKELSAKINHDLSSTNAKLALIAFILFYNPCLPTSIAMFTQLKSVKNTIIYLFFSFAQAYFISVLAFVVATIIFVN